MVHRNNTGRLGAGFISVCLETRWLGPKRGFHVLELYCKSGFGLQSKKERKKERKKLENKHLHSRALLFSLQSTHVIHVHVCIDV